MDFTIGNCNRSFYKHAKLIDQHSRDQLSLLPTDILHHILSFLDTPEVVETSLLSRKWRYIWTSVPRLNFDFRGFREREQCQELNLYESLSKFWEVVKWTIISREAPIHRLHILCDSFDIDQLKPLLRLCAMRNVEELDLIAEFAIHNCPFPHAFIESVVAITQNVNGLIYLQASTAFGNLKSLHLVKVLIPGTDITEKFFSDCGVLENLSLEYCCFVMIKVLDISAHKLQKLTFVNTGPHNWLSTMFNFRGKLTVHAPNLESVCYIGPMLHSFELSEMSHLNHALIQVINEGCPRALCSKLGAMVSGFNHAKELSLSADFVLCFCPAYSWMCCHSILFERLRCLKLELVCNADYMEGLINLLKLSPNLEILCIQFVKRWRTSTWKSREEDVPCLSHHFKEIEITKFYDSTYSMEFIKFFLQNGKSLEKIKIVQDKQKVIPQKFYALQAVQLASKAVSVSVISLSASGKKELLQFVYKKCRVGLWKWIQEMKNKSKTSMRYAAMKSGGSFGRREKRLMCTMWHSVAAKKLKHVM